MAKRQTLVELDDARLAELDRRAASCGRSRSELVRDAVDQFLETGHSAAIDGAIVAGYHHRPASTPDASVLAGAIAAIKRSPGSGPLRLGG